MDERLTFACPHCHAALEAEVGSEGASLACPSCGGQLTIPRQDAASRTQASNIVCPGCKAPWQKGAVLCVACGFDARTGKQLRTKTTMARNRPLFVSHKVSRGMPSITTGALLTVVILAGIVGYYWRQASEREQERAAKAAVQAQQLVQSKQQSQVLGEAFDSAKRSLADPTNSSAFANLKRVVDSCPLATNRSEAFALISDYAKREKRAQTARGMELAIALENAARDGELDAVDRLLEQGAPIDGVDRVSPILRAHASGQADVMAHLLEKGADPAPLLAAASRYPGSLDTLDMLAQKGSGVTNCRILEAFSLEGKGRSGERLLCSFKLLEYLLDNGAAASETNAVGQTALHLLAQVHRGLVQVDDEAVSGERGVLAAAKKLLEKGCDPDVYATTAPVPPVGSAAARAERARLDKERAETVRAEKERAEKARLEKTRPDKPRKRAAERWTALDYAAVRGDVQLVDVLMQHYQARGTQTLDVARSAVLLASRRNSPCYDFTPCEYSEGDIEPLTLEETMAEHLVKKGAPANFQDEYGVTCLHEAARNASERSCRALVDAGADLNAKTDTGLTPLHFAVAKGDAAVTKILLDAGADVNVQDADGATPLHLALRQKSEALLDLLLEKDANVELADKRGMSALHVAAEASDWDSTRRLLAEGAEVNRPDRIGRTPVLIAAENMKTNVSMLVAGLIDAGADVTVKDAKGRDAVEALTSQKDKAIREIGYLFQQGDAKDYVKFVQGELKKARAAAAPAPLEK